MNRFDFFKLASGECKDIHFELLSNRDIKKITNETITDCKKVDSEILSFSVYLTDGKNSPRFTQFVQKFR